MYDIIYGSMISYSVEAHIISYDKNRIWYHSTFHVRVRGSISYHNIIYDIINWNTMILDMISNVSLRRYCLCRQAPPLLPGCNRDTGYTASSANLQPCLWSWSCWSAHPTRRRRWQRCSLSAAAWRKWDALLQGGGERRNSELGSGHSTSCGHGWGALREGCREFICKSSRVGTP
jgi:hypothetical protein